MAKKNEKTETPSPWHLIDQVLGKSMDLTVTAMQTGEHVMVHTIITAFTNEKKTETAIITTDTCVLPNSKI